MLVAGADPRDRGVRCNGGCGVLGLIAPGEGRRGAWQSRVCPCLGSSRGR